MTAPAHTPDPNKSPDRRISRRALVVGGTGLIAAGAMHSRVLGQNATPVHTSASPVSASPVASPVASPGAGIPAASPVAGPEMIGNLRVVRDQRPTFATSPVRGGTLSIARVGTNNLDFNPVAFAQDYQIPSSYLEPLVWIDGVTMEPLPWLAESWTSTRDGQAITLKLRSDVKWQDGTDFTASDVAFSFEVYRDDFNSGAYTMFTNLSSVEVRDDHTVVARLSAPDGNWIRNACSQLVFQQAQYGATWTALPVGSRTLSGFDWNAAAPIGTGPWTVTDFRDSRVDFRANRAYWGDSPWATEMRTDYLADSAAQRAAWHEGRADVIWPVAFADVAGISDRAGTLFAAESARVMFAAFNFNNPARPDPALLVNADVRNALAMGIDRSRYANEVFGSFCRTSLASTIIQPDLVLDGLTNPAFDPDQARTLLLDAGFTIPKSDGVLRAADGTALSLDVIVRKGDDPQLEAVLASIAVDLRTVGVMLDVRVLSPDRFDVVWLTEHTFDLIAFSYSVYPGFSDFDLYGSDWDVRSNPNGFNPGGYRNQEVDRAITRALAATSEVDYLSALHAVQRKVGRDDLFGLWLGSPDELVLAQADIAGFRANKPWQTAESARMWGTNG